MSDQSNYPEEELTPFPDETISDPAIDTDVTPLPEEVTDPGKVTQTRAPSRTTRVLLGLLLLAVAAFLWFNNFRQPAPAPAVTTGSPLVPGNNGAARLPGANGSATAVPLVSSAVEQGDGPEGLPGSSAPGTPEAASGPELPLSDSVTPVVVLDGDGEPVLPFVLNGVVARELVVSDLPFLVTEVEPDQDAAADEQADSDATTPVAQRVSINPFSPVVLAPVPEAETAFAGPTPDAVEPGDADAGVADGETVIDVSIPSGPDESAVTTVIAPGSDRPAARPSASQTPAATAPPPAAAAPAPSAPAPAVVAPSAPTATTAAVNGTDAVAGAPQAQALPRVLPGPSLSPVPQVLQERRATSDIPQPNLAQVAVISEPQEAEVDSAETSSLASATGQPVADDPQSPLQPVASRVMPSDADPLVAGVTPLSRYLRDNDVTFTGMVLGPVSHGVFRSINQPRAMVIAIGQELPETEIVLTDLRGQEAEFTLADATQSLTLDLRR